MNKQVGRRGFTIIELLIASSVFSVVLLICAAALIQIGRTYYKGITASQTQEAARSIIEEISKTIQFNGGNVSLIYGVNPDSTLSQNPTSPSYICIGNRRFIFVLNRQVTPSGSRGEDQSRHALVVDSRACEPSGAGQPLDNDDGSLLSDSKELMPPNMRLTGLEIKRVDPGRPDLYKVTVRIISGHREVLLDTDPAVPGPDLPGKCVPNAAGGQFCSIAELSTTVQKRVK